ncbi:DUF6427 family protein [Aestuariivivens sp. NBU2969]|uniref:DUF6427 family protein n=1 Tax=Aestuariivivens sp. NBU2969 TaxID=2873267 RepID=UPI001CBBB93A|nr:DUF6427 family protein [Aestuariivivens sp. NBU2969]
MITSIFSKSKPINFILVFFITALAFLIANIKFSIQPLTITLVMEKVVLFFVCYSSILLLNFIVSKNGLTKNNNYEILLYSLFLLAVLETTQNTNVLFANFFILLALRRILSIRSQTKLNKKLFDAAFWIAIAALFYFWTILFFILIIVALMLYTDNKLNHWIIPFTGIITVFVFTVAASIMYYDSYFGAFKSLPYISYDFSYYNTGGFIVVIAVLLIFGLWSLIFYTRRIKKKKKALRPSFNLILFAFIMAVAVIVLAPKKDSSEFLFMFTPLAIIITNYIETIKKKWFREVFLVALILLPFVNLML